MNIRNYGVGNFGVDQAILKYINLPNNNEADHIILSFVPETILRVHSYWKHYIEFGIFMVLNQNSNIQIINWNCYQIY